MILTTTFRQGGAFQNIDIHTGDFRRINLLLPPFNFPGPLETLPDSDGKTMVLFTREQVVKLLPQMSQAIAGWRDHRESLEIWCLKLEGTRPLARGKPTLILE